MKDNILINQSVAILCDGNNIERSIHEESGKNNIMINFDTLIPKLLSGRGLNRLIYFREGKNISTKFAERLHNYYYGSVVPCHKSADIPLSIKATQLASKVDTIIIMSGDSDYVELVLHLKSEGVRVEIAAVRKTTARILIEEADHFHAITKDDWFEYSRKNVGSYRKDVVNFDNRNRQKRPEPKSAVKTVKSPEPKSVNHPLKKLEPKSVPKTPSLQSVKKPESKPTKVAKKTKKGTDKPTKK